MRVTVFFPAVPRKSVSRARGNVPAFGLTGIWRVGTGSWARQTAARRRPDTSNLGIFIVPTEPEKGEAAFPPAVSSWNPSPRLRDLLRGCPMKLLPALAALAALTATAAAQTAAAPDVESPALRY